MDIEMLLSLFLLTFVNVIAPGPGVITIATISAGFGMVRASAVVLGALAGTVLLLLVAYGATVGLFALGRGVYLAAQGLGVLVLGYLAWALWPRRGDSADEPQVQPGQCFWTGAGMALGQPMSLVFMLAVFPQFLGDTRADILNPFLMGMAVFFATALGLGLVVLLGNACSATFRAYRVALARMAALILGGFAIGFALFGLRSLAYAEGAPV